MKIYKGEKDFDKMEKLSAKIMKNEDIRLVGMKAAVEAQMQKKEFAEALATANKAFELRQDLYWVIESAFELRAKAGDWDGALQVLSSGIKKKIIPQDKFKRLKAIVLFEMALEAQKKATTSISSGFVRRRLNVTKRWFRPRWPWPAIMWRTTISSARRQRFC